MRDGPTRLFGAGDINVPGDREADGQESMRGQRDYCRMGCLSLGERGENSES